MLRQSVTFVPYLMYGLWVLWLLASASDSMLTVAQMQSKGPGFERGIPLTGHHAMLVLDLLLPILVWYLVRKYGAGWNELQIGLVLGAALALSYMMHLTYVSAGTRFPEAPTYGGELTTTGWLHFVYMALAFAVVGLFYLCTKKPDVFDVWLTSIWLLIHVTIGVHVPLKLLKPSWFPYHGITDIGTWGPVAGVAVILTSFSLFVTR